MAAETNRRIDEVMQRLQEFEAKETMMKDESVATVQQQPGGWRPLYLVVGFEANQLREDLEERSLGRLGDEERFCLAPLAPRQ